MYINISQPVSIAKRSRLKPRTKAPAMVFRLKEPLAQFLRAEAEKSNKTMTSILEELLAYRKQFKSWPPEIGRFGK
jgi:hypothetical protein